MNKSQRKQRLKEIKAKAKAARRTRPALADRPADVVDDAGEAATSPPLVDPLLHARGSMKLAEVEIEDSQRPELSNEQARQMLQRAARFLNEVIELVDDAIESASPEDRREALAIRNNKAAADEVTQKNSRGSVNKLVSLMNLGTRAANLMQRILGVTNPDVPKLGQAA